MSIKIEIETYNDKWNRQFHKEKEILLNLLYPLQPQIEHIGSTAIEGLSAKPIIDIMIGVSNDIELARLELILGKEPEYVYYRKWEETMPFRKFFVKVKSENKSELKLIPPIVDIGEDQPELVLKYRTCHIHAVPLTHEFWKNHLAFRDFLKKNQEIKNEYNELKLKLTEKEWERSEDYSRAKSDFIQKVHRMMQE